MKLTLRLPKIFGGGGSVEQGSGTDFGTGLPPYKAPEQPKRVSRKKLLQLLDFEEKKLRRPITRNPVPEPKAK